MVLYTPDDTQALAADYFEPSQAGMQSHTFQIRNTEEIDLNGIIVAFMNKSGMPFSIDEVEISQDIKSGDNVVMPFSSHKTNATSMKVNNLEQGIDHGYAVTASTVRDYESYVSSRSDIRIVRTSTASVGNVAVDGDTMTVTALPGAIAVAGEGTARVFTPAGVQVGTVSADAPLSVATGIYIVATPSSTVKVSVK